MKTPSISESEWAVMEVLWESAPLTAGEVARTLKGSRGWAENTVRTLLTRLLDKGALKTREEAGSSRLYLPAVRREDCVQAESASFLQRIFQGSSKPLLVHFARNAQLTPDEVKELKRLLDQSLDSDPQNPKP